MLQQCQDIFTAIEKLSYNDFHSIFSDKSHERASRSSVYSAAILARQGHDGHDVNAMRMRDSLLWRSTYMSFM